MKDFTNLCGRIYLDDPDTGRTARCEKPAGHPRPLDHGPEPEEGTMSDTYPRTRFGTRENAEEVTRGRRPDVCDALQWLTFSHLPEALQCYSKPFYGAAVDLLIVIKADSPELTTALNKLVEAKDSAMRAGIKADTGRAGSVPRPQTVVDPPLFGRPIRDNPQA